MHPAATDDKDIPGGKLPGFVAGDVQTTAADDDYHLGKFVLMRRKS